MVVQIPSSKKDPAGLKKSNGNSTESSGLTAGHSNSDLDLHETPESTMDTDDHEDKKMESKKILTISEKYLYRQLNTLQFHIRVLYVLTTCLVLLLVSSAIVCYLQILSLKHELDHKANKSQLVRFQFSRRINPKLDLYLPSTSQSDEMSFATVGSSSSNKRKKRQSANSEEGTDAEDNSGPKDWTWMSSYSRVPVSNS